MQEFLLITVKIFVFFCNLYIKCLNCKKNNMEFKRFLVFVLILVVQQISMTAKGQPTASSCSLQNPPNDYVYWGFLGNQVIHVELKNANTLIATVALECKTIGRTFNYILPPFTKFEAQEFSIFGYVPISWEFKLSTASGACMVLGYARWKDYEPDRPDYKD